MIIIITGTPGTGKSTLAKKLASDIKAVYIDGNTIIEKYDLSEGYDNKRSCKIIDAKKFSEAVLKECKENKKTYILDSHLSHQLPPEEVKLCIICKCSLKELKARLEKRDYSKEKIRENLDTEIFEICLSQAKEKGHKTIEYNSTKKDQNNNYKTLLTYIKKLL